MMGYLERVGVPGLVVLTKMDKLKQSERKKAVARALADLALDDEQLLPFSSRTGEGRDALLAALDELLGDAGHEATGAGVP
jgi:GTP-binding protein